MGIRLSPFHGKQNLHHVRCLAAVVYLDWTADNYAQKASAEKSVLIAIAIAIAIARCLSYGTLGRATPPLIIKRLALHLFIGYSRLPPRSLSNWVLRYSELSSEALIG